MWWGGQAGRWVAAPASPGSAPARPNGRAVPDSLCPEESATRPAVERESSGSGRSEQGRGEGPAAPSSQSGGRRLEAARWPRCWGCVPVGVLGLGAGLGGLRLTPAGPAGFPGIRAERGLIRIRHSTGELRRLPCLLAHQVFKGVTAGTSRDLVLPINHFHWQMPCPNSKDKLPLLSLGEFGKRRMVTPTVPLLGCRRRSKAVGSGGDRAPGLSAVPAAMLSGNARTVVRLLAFLQPTREHVGEFP